jgi:hypothetical protein
MVVLSALGLAWQLIAAALRQGHLVCGEDLLGPVGSAVLKASLLRLGSGSTGGASPLPLFTQVNVKFGSYLFSTAS